MKLNEEVTQKLYDAKLGLMDLADERMMGELKASSGLVQRRIIFALEAIDDALEGNIHFKNK